MSRFTSMRGRFNGSGAPSDGDSGDVVRATPLPFMESLDLRSKDAHERRRSLNIKPTHLVLAAAIPLAAVIVGLLYVSASSKADDAKAERDAAAEQVQQAQQRAIALTAQGELLDAVASAGESQLTSTVAFSLADRVAWDRVVRSVSKIRPEGTWYSTLGGTTTDAAATAAAGATAGATEAAGAEEAAGAVGPKGELRITGFSLDHARVAKLISRLDTLRDLETIRLESTATTEIGEQKVIQFTLAADVRSSR